MIYNRDKIENIIESIEKQGYKYHHSSYKQGYVKVKEINVNAYRGRFGTGYTVCRNNPNSSRYMIIDYYVKK